MRQCIQTADRKLVSFVGGWRKELVSQSAIHHVMGCFSLLCCSGVSVNMRPSFSSPTPLYGFSFMGFILISMQVHNHVWQCYHVYYCKMFLYREERSEWEHFSASCCWHWNVVVKSEDDLTSLLRLEKGKEHSINHGVYTMWMNDILLTPFSWCNRHHCCGDWYVLENSTSQANSYHDKLSTVVCSLFMLRVHTQINNRSMLCGFNTWLCDNLGFALPKQ